MTARSRGWVKHRAHETLGPFYSRSRCACNLVNLLERINTLILNQHQFIRCPWLPDGETRLWLRYHTNPNPASQLATNRLRE